MSFNYKEDEERNVEEGPEFSLKCMCKAGAVNILHK